MSLPQSLRSGSGRRRILVAVRATTEGKLDTVNIATFVPEAASIEGIAWYTKGGTTPTSETAGTTLTFATTILTFGSGTSGSTFNVGAIVNIT